jgi:hypothetical protein
MEPTHPSYCAIISLRRAAHSKRWADTPILARLTMFTRLTVFVTTLGLLPGLVLAQTSVLAAQPRVRITGAEEYEIPGVLKIDAARVSDATITVQETVVRVVSPATGQELIVLRPGRRLVGRATEVKDQVVEFLPDGQVSLADDYNKPVIIYSPEATLVKGFPQSVPRATTLERVEQFLGKHLRSAA